MHDFTVGMHISEAIYGCSEDSVADSVMENGLVAITLSDFINIYSVELGEYYNEDFGQVDKPVCPGDSYGDTFAFVLVDHGPDHLPQNIKKKIKKAGKWRRDKLKHQWSYVNPMNRIHGFLIMNNVTNEHHKDLTLSIDAICSSYFSEKKGIGNDLMEVAKKFATNMGTYDIVLEVANEFSARCSSDSDDESDESDESDDESDESDDESDESDDDDESDESDDDDESDESDDEPWVPDESVLDILSSELWKKCMRKNNDVPYFNLDQMYLEEELNNYFNSTTNSDDSSSWQGLPKNIIKDKDDPEDGEYGGPWYQMGKKSQSKLMKFYERHGFKEDIEVHLDWCCFGSIPFPSMRYTLPYN
jgi:hypothetical protein